MYCKKNDNFPYVCSVYTVRHDAPCWFTGSRSKTVSPLRVHSRATAFWMIPQLTLLLLAWAGITRKEARRRRTIQISHW